MAGRVLYPLKGIRTKAGYYPLKIDRSYRWQEPKVGITPAALKQAQQIGKTIFGLQRAGVRFQNNIVELPSIFIRTKGKGAGNDSIYTVLLSADEISRLGNMFGLGPNRCNVLNGAFFEAEQARLFNRLKFGVKPIWSELLEPDWRAEFLSWIAGKGSLPSPAELNWKTSLRGVLTFPALLCQVNFSPSNKASVSGKLVLKEENGAFRAYFFHNGKFSVYGLSPDNVEFLESGQRTDSEDSYSKNSFLELLGKRPKRTTYNFSRTLKRRSSRKIFSLGNIRGEPAGMHANQRCGLEVGKRYYFRIIREDDRLEIKLYAGAESNEPICFANVSLNDGEIARSYIMLETP